jgi:hypothetical protein
MQRCRRRGKRAGQRWRTCTGALAQSTATRLPGRLAVALGGSGCVVDAVWERGASVIRAVRERVQSVSGGHRLRHGGMNGGGDLAEKCEDQNQPTVRKSDHGQSLASPDLGCKFVAGRAAGPLAVLLILPTARSPSFR